MFSKSKISQSMIDAVNSVLGEKAESAEDKIVNNVLLDEAAEKVVTPTGMKVYGSSYGNSAKARRDQTKSAVDTIKGPKDKEVKEDMSFAKKLISTVTEKKDVVMPEDSATPTKGTDVADKSWLKDAGKKPTVKSDLKNLGRFLMGKKETNEELELDQQINEVLSKDATAGEWIHDFVHSDNPKFAGKSKAERKKQALAAYYAKQNEEVDCSCHDDAPITTDTLAGRLPGGKINSFKSYKKKLKGDLSDDGTPTTMEPEKTPARASIKAEEVELEEGRMKDIATNKDEDERLGSWSKETPWMPSKGTVTDKSGAKHTPMSRAKDLARSAFKKLKNETMMGKAGTTSESK